MRPGLVIALAGLAFACSPSKPPDPPGAVQDKAGDAMLTVRAQFPDIDCTVSYVLQPSGDYTISGVKRRNVSPDECVADLIACAQTINLNGKADAGAWEAATKSLAGNGFWELKSASQAFNVVSPQAPDHDAQVAALPAADAAPSNAGTMEIDLRRDDGKRKHLYDLLGNGAPKLYADLEAALHLRETACEANKPQ